MPSINRDGSAPLGGTNVGPITGAGAARILSTIILSVASDAARRELEAMMVSAPYRSTFVESFVEAGKVEGRAEDVIKILDARGIKLAGEERGQVTSCTDLDQLDLWFGRALTASSAADVFQD